MKLQAIVLLIVMLFSGALPLAQAQYSNTDEKAEGVNPRFAMMTKEVGFLCGQFLPSSIPGITELIPMCGGRIGIKIGQDLFLEPGLLLGAGRGQKYMQGSLSFRGDYQIADFVASFYGGPDIHYATAPIYSLVPTGEETSIYAGLHVGGAIWWEFSPVMYLRADLKFNFNPGTSLLVGLGLVLRFDAAGEQQQGQQ